MTPIPGAVSLLLLVASASLAQTCPCDCDGDRAVHVSELTTAIAIGLARLDIERCPPADVNASASVEVNELVSGVGAALAGCPAAPQPTPTPTTNFTAAQLAGARALWRAQGLFHYRYRYTLGCFCPGPRDVVIEVFDDRLAGFRDPESGEPVPLPDFPDLYFTIDGLFDYLQQSLGNADVIEVEFHPTLGYPAAVFIDRYRQALDDELWIGIKDVEPLQTGGRCRTEHDCDVSAESCIPPGGFAGCGICLDHQPECTADGDCSAGGVCEPVGYSADTCACDPTVLVCKPGCTGDADCPAGHTCGADRHCAPIPCRVRECGGMRCEDSCPDLFTCSARVPLAGECRRTTCTNDSDCGQRAGFCVDGECHPGPGRCDVVPP